jgi:hypothetical protein
MERFIGCSPTGHEKSLRGLGAGLGDDEQRVSKRKMF